MRGLGIWAYALPERVPGLCSHRCPPPPQQANGMHARINPVPAWRPLPWRRDGRKKVFCRPFARNALLHLHCAPLLPMANLRRPSNTAHLRGCAVPPNTEGKTASHASLLSSKLPCSARIHIVRGWALQPLPAEEPESTPTGRPLQGQEHSRWTRAHSGAPSRARRRSSHLAKANRRRGRACSPSERGGPQRACASSHSLGTP